MANEDHLALLKQGVEGWNKWQHENELIKLDLREADLRRADLFEANLSNADLFEANLSNADLSEADFFEANLNDSIEPDLVGADLREADLREANLREAHLSGANLSGANLREANLSNADLSGADLSGANLFGANLRKAHLSGANLREANLSNADLRGAHLREAHLSGANLREAHLSGADLRDADLSGANLREAHLSGADLVGADLSGANLREAHLSGADLVGADLSGAHLREADLTGATLGGAQLIETDLTSANLTGCHIYGVSAWNLTLEGAQQRDLIITPYDEPEITVDNLEVAQFIYLLLNNKKIRDVIDTITSKTVLILGRFTLERKAVLDAIREELRHRDYLPIVFDFDKPASKDLTGTVSTLANMARFIIADLTDPSSVPHELAMVVPGTVVPVQPVLMEGQREYAMFLDLKRRHHWVLEPYQYSSQELLIAHLEERVIGPAEAKARELRGGTSL